MQQLTGETIALQAAAALHDNAFESEPGYCQKFARQVAEAVGGRIGDVMDSHRAGTARQTMNNFRGTVFSVKSAHFLTVVSSELQEGDYLYKGMFTSGPTGHVGIIAAGHMVGLPDLDFVVIENSSYHENPNAYGNVSGAKGFRTLQGFGQCEMIVRLTNGLTPIPGVLNETN